MSGYISQRRTQASNYKEVYGWAKFPSSYAMSNIYNGGTIVGQCHPEIFFGMYGGGYGFDAGLALIGTKWRVFVQRSKSATPSSAPYGWDEDKRGDLALKPDDNVYYQVTVVEKAGKYYVRINISKQGRDGTDLMTSPFDSEITNAAGIHYINNGGIVNREITIATNYDTDYAWETSGAYMFNAQWKECGLTSVSNVTYKFNSATTYKWSGSNNSYYIPQHKAANKLKK